ncbi:MAG: cytochrome c3 family protein [Thermoguttaceae bacterium]|nr:cytochrome c3 family protein [Thermoguttaceae bacterium]MDW8039145.1 cytochrome c3 family protein [Thermoguttaceae bacterium]
MLVIRIGFSGAQSAKESQPSGSLPPLKVDRKTAPRLQELPSESRPSQQVLKKRADNSACYVCHGNYEGEELAQIHREGNVGCIDCHGRSLAHRNDESHLTPPDKMYPTEAIDLSCQGCHETHDAPAKKVLVRWRQKCPQKADPEQLVCTDCHGDHRLPRREILWDKRTGKLLSGKSNN